MYKIINSCQSKYFDNIHRLTVSNNKDSIIFDIPSSLVESLSNGFDINVINTKSPACYNPDNIFELNGIVFKTEKNKAFISFGGLLMELENNIYNVEQDNEYTFVFTTNKKEKYDKEKD
jgi:hypothetical protein